jgi:hypothetical protein
MRDGALLSQTEAAAAIGELQREIHRLQRAIRLAIEKQLSFLTGRSTETLVNNQELAQQIHQLLDSHGLRLKCPECGHPAILRVSPRPGMSSGAFVFDHTIDGRRTFHGGRQVVPELQLTAKPLRRKQKGL